MAPVAGALGYSIEDTAVAIGLMANSGIKASQAGTSLRSLLTNLTHPVGQAADAIDELKISITNADGSVKRYRRLCRNYEKNLEHYLNQRERSMPQC